MLIVSLSLVVTFVQARCLHRRTATENYEIIAYPAAGALEYPVAPFQTMRLRKPVH